MHLFRIFRPALAAASLFATVAASAVDLTGSYENTGSLVASTPPAEGTASFQGLLELNFDYALTRALHAATNRVTIHQTATHFRIECRDADGKVTWSGAWEVGVGCALGEDRVDLTFRAPRFKDDGFIFSLRPMPQRDLLFVEVQRINATTLGPSNQPVGSFLFGRLASE